MMRIVGPAEPMGVQHGTGAREGRLGAWLEWFAGRLRMARQGAADHAVAALDDRQLVDCGLVQELALRQRRMPVDGAVLRRLMSLS